MTISRKENGASGKVNLEPDVEGMWNIFLKKKHVKGVEKFSSAQRKTASSFMGTMPSMRMGGG